MTPTALADPSKPHRRPTFQPAKMLHHARMSAMTGRTAAFRVGVERRLWAVSDNNEIGSGQFAAPCTFRHEGRIADLRCKCEIKTAEQRKRTLGPSASFSVVQTQLMAARSPLNQISAMQLKSAIMVETKTFNNHLGFERGFPHMRPSLPTMTVGSSWSCSKTLEWNCASRAMIRPLPRALRG